MITKIVTIHSRDGSEAHNVGVNSCGNVEFEKITDCYQLLGIVFPNVCKSSHFLCFRNLVQSRYDVMTMREIIDWYYANKLLTHE